MSSISARQIMCSKEDYCTIMRRYMQEANAHKKGFSPFVLTNMQKSKEEGQEHTIMKGIAYKGAAGDSGVLIRHCPWCGVNFYRLYELDASECAALQPVKEA